MMSSAVSYPSLRMGWISTACPRSTCGWTCSDDETTLVERFTPSADGAELVYDISATDPRTFTRTVTAEGYRTFRWTPGFEFLPQNCVLDGGP